MAATGPPRCALWPRITTVSYTHLDVYKRQTPGPDTKAIVSYLPDADWLPDWMRVEQLVDMFREFYADFDPAKANEMLARLELEPKARLKTRCV